MKPSLVIVCVLLSAAVAVWMVACNARVTIEGAGAAEQQDDQPAHVDDHGDEDAGTNGGFGTNGDGGPNGGFGTDGDFTTDGGFGMDGDFGTDGDFTTDGDFGTDADLGTNGAGLDDDEGDVGTDGLGTNGAGTNG